MQELFDFTKYSRQVCTVSKELISSGHNMKEISGAMHLLDALDRPGITTMRTSIDYNHEISKALFWPQFHTVNLVAWAVGLLPFKDNFHSNEAQGEAEALISALSAGMVGPGDQIGTFDAELIKRTCRADGLLLKPDRPATPLDAMFLPHQRPYLTRTWSRREDAGEWTYLSAYRFSGACTAQTYIADGGWV